MNSITGEALLLGLASGPACVASCGPVVTPWLLDQQGGLHRGAGQLSIFLGARLAGYLGFAVLAWSFGLAVQSGAGAQPLIFAAAHLLLAVALVTYAVGRWRLAAHAPKSELVTIGAQSGFRSWSPVAFGFLTGINLCPPFLAAAVRAAELRSLPVALLFFLLFFMGTAVWFVPFTALGWVRRSEPMLAVSRIALLLVAAYYAYLGTVVLAGRLLHG